MSLWSRSNKLKPYQTGKEERTFTDPLEAVAYMESLYSHNILYLRQEFEAYARDQSVEPHVRACYPLYPHAGQLAQTPADVDVLRLCQPARHL